MSARDYTSILNQGITAGSTLGVALIPKHKAVYISNTNAGSTAGVVLKTMKPDGLPATGSLTLTLSAAGDTLLPFRVYSIDTVTTNKVNVSFLM